MTTTADNSASQSSLPRWDLGRFGFATPFSKDIDAHLGETAKLAESFKVRKTAEDIMHIYFRFRYSLIYIVIFL